MNDKRAKRLRLLARSLARQRQRPRLTYQWNQRTRVIRVHSACERGMYLIFKRAANANRY